MMEYPNFHQKALRIDFDRNSMKAANLTSNSQPYLTITNPGKTGFRTEIREALSQRLLVTVQHRELLWDIITFADHHGGKAIRLSKWMKEGTLPDNYPATYIDTGVGYYFWKPDVNRRFVLYAAQDLAYTSPLAYMIHTGPTPSLVLERGTESIRDQVIASFIMVEQAMRMTEKASKVGEGMAYAEANVFA
ncbi:hypothetical protein BDZ94DRAFT_866735 [Collybia nuda]|uniref:DUF6593 domain-containing protein n=1 Tax=Collybia nuda TaxID=64659 RepID=A0A9P5Y260_9AGAR|nr:hypothetical protein BDZ94DRAFT_866735 [Collybia nuda]